MKSKSKNRCCYLNQIFIFLAFFAIGWAVTSTTSEYAAKKHLWLENAIQDVQAIDDSQLYIKPAYLSANQLKSELSNILFKEEKVEHDSIRGIYITAHTAASKHFWDIIDALIASGGNAVVIDVEVSGGKLAFVPEDPYLASINPGSTVLSNLKSLIRELHKKDIYVIARQVIFNDPYTAGKKPEWRIRYKDGSLYDGRWLDASHPEAQRYNLLISKEVAKMGFDEIQYDYIRFPDGYHYYEEFYYDETAKERWEVINDFLADAHKLTQELDVKLGVDVFGATIWGDIDWTLVGQYIPEIAKNVDVIYPMTYPSHVAPGYYGHNNPYGDPYSFIYNSIERFIEAADGHAEIRTWVQGFPLRIPNFGDWFVQEQVQATYDAGARGWVVWSPGNKYAVTWSSLGILPPELPEPETEEETNPEVE